jgi:uncharacterized protein (DUF58 family)
VRRAGATAAVGVIDRELVRKARRIELASRRLVDQQLAGQYHSVFKGRGLVFADVRAYYPGDDVRAIDWNVSARMNVPHIKQFVEERDRTIILVLDCSASLGFGSTTRAKRELAAELAAVVALSAIKNNDRVGLMLVSDRVERYLPAKKGKRHVMRIIAEILAVNPASPRTNLAVGLGLLGRVLRRRAVVFLLSDFLDQPARWDGALGMLAQRHEVVPVVVTDPMEAALPEVGLVHFEDLETGELVEIDTAGPAARAYATASAAAAAERDQRLRRLGLDVVTVATDQPYVEALIAFFRARARARHKVRG